MMDCEPITEYFGLVYDGEADALVENWLRIISDPAPRVGKITSGMEQPSRAWRIWNRLLPPMTS